jgi:ATP-dependent DNA helicase PIF1
LSADSLLDDAESAIYPVEFLNSLNISGLPPHKLTLKVNQPIILLRNTDPYNGLCNGTRLICRKFYENLIEAEILIGNFAGKIVFISKLPITLSETNLPINFKRLQFPIRPAFAMTINKSQGQTLDFVGLWLKNSVFSHGQLYVAMSRVTAEKNLKVVLNKSGNKYVTRNVIFKSVFS